MKRSQWFVLAWSCMLIGMMFINLDNLYRGCFVTASASLNYYDVWCIVNSEMYEPFIHLFYALWIVFMIIGFLEPKKK